MKSFYYSSTLDCITIDDSILLLGTILRRIETSLRASFRNNNERTNDTMRVKIDAIFHLIEAFRLPEVENPTIDGQQWELIVAPTQLFNAKAMTDLVTNFKGRRKLSNSLRRLFNMHRWLRFHIIAPNNGKLL